MPLPDGSQKALEVHIFPEAMRGTGDGHRGWDLQPSSTMTNGNVEQTSASSDGQMLTLKYKDGEKKIVVPPGMPDCRLRAGRRGRTQGWCAHFHQRCQQAAGRHALGGARQRRPRCRPAHVRASYQPCHLLAIPGSCPGTAGIVKIRVRLSRPVAPRICLKWVWSSRAPAIASPRL